MSCCEADAPRLVQDPHPPVQFTPWSGQLAEGGPAALPEDCAAREPFTAAAMWGPGLA